MVFFTEKPKRVLAACCKVEVIYGALGLTLVGLSSRNATLYSASFNTLSRASVSALFLIGYGLSRFFMEFFREPDADQGFILFGWVTKGQMLSFPMIVAGLLLMAFAYQRKIYDWTLHK